MIKITIIQNGLSRSPLQLDRCCSPPGSSAPSAGDLFGALVVFGVEVCTSGGHDPWPSMTSLSFASVMAAYGVAAATNGTA
ncbi:hypothetical protein SUGI_0250090 [Cryptomeria japonica]|nr:hypothetical protein SUGI_0250090 [Cryptomeria japonica]